MRYLDYSLREKNPYWWDNIERQERKQEMENMIEMAKQEIYYYINQRIEEQDNKINKLNNSKNERTKNVDVSIDIDRESPYIRKIIKETKNWLNDEINGRNR